MTEKEQGYSVKDYGCRVKRYVQTLDLKEDPELIREYRRLHSEPEIWQEILDGIHAVGILEMDIYILGCRLVMIVEAAEDFDWQEAMSRLGTLPRQAEWEGVVDRFQACVPGCSSDEKWQMMERMFHLYR